MRSHSLKQEVENDEVELGTRRSNRNLQEVDYRIMHSGSNQMITVGDTAMSEKMALHNHTEGDISIRLLYFESNWGKRRIKESIAVRQLRSSLNGNDALYISPIYELVPSKYSGDDDWFDSGDVINNKYTGMASVVRKSDEYEL